MAVTTDIVATWRNPRAITRARLAQGIGEDRVLSILIGALLLVFVAQWPGAARAAHFDPAAPLPPRLLAAFLAVLALVPVMYGVAAVSHLAARLAGGRGTWRGARIALFGALLATAPAMLFQGLVAGLIGPGPSLTAVGIVVAAAFVVIWGVSWHEAEFSRPQVQRRQKG